MRWDRLWRIRATEIDPNNFVVAANLALLLNSCLKEYEGAEALYKKILENDQTNVITWYNFASLLDQGLMRPEEAKIMYQRAIDVNPNEPYIFVNRAALFLTAGDVEAARRDLGEVWQHGAGGNRVIARGLMLLALLDMLENRDPQLPLKYLKAVMKAGFVPSPWAVDGLMQRLRRLLRPEGYRLASRILDALADLSLLTELDAIPVWRNVPEVELKGNWLERFRGNLAR